MKKFKFFSSKPVAGSIIGFINGFFGAGGGLVCVPILTKMGFERKEAHTNAVAIIFPITVISAINYIFSGRVSFSDSFIYLPTGLLGAFVGTRIMKKISPFLIRRVFGGFMIWAGWRLIFG